MHPNRRRALVWILITAALVTVPGCRAPAGEEPAAAPPAAEPPSPSEARPPLDPPFFGLSTNSRTYEAGSRAFVPRFDNYAYYVYVHFPGPVIENSAVESIRVEPSSALLERTWTSPEAGTGAAAMLRLRIAPQPVDGTVTVTVREGLRSPDGKVLQEPARFTVTFAEPTRARLTLRGMTYLPWPEEHELTSDNPYGAAPVFRPGPAVLEASFTRPVDRAAVEAALTAGLPRGISAGRPSWSEDGRSVSLPLNQDVEDTVRVTVALTNQFLVAVPKPVLDELGMALADEGTALRWVVALPGDVVRTAGASTSSQPAGTIPLLPGLQVAGPQALHGGRVLTWHVIEDEADCTSLALSVWDVGSGVGLPLSHSASSCLGWAGWLNDDAAVLVSGNRIERFDLPAGRPLADLPRAITPTVWLEAEQGIFVGAAFAPDGRVAVFQATPPENGAALGRVDLLILGPDGRVLQRAAEVSDLVSNEVVWRTIPAAWSPDGSTLAFVAFRAGEAVNDAGYPAQIDTRLVTWDAGTGAAGAATVHEVAATDVNWRPGGRELWIRAEDGWQVFDPATGASRPAGVDIWWVHGFSPDGRYLLALREDGHVVVDLTTGEVVSVRALQPLGWNPADGHAYWVTRQDGP